MNTIGFILYSLLMFFMGAMWMLATVTTELQETEEEKEYVISYWRVDELGLVSRWETVVDIDICATMRQMFDSAWDYHNEEDSGDFKITTCDVYDGRTLVDYNRGPR